MKQAKWFLLLHIILGIYAGSSVCSKLAAQQPFLSAAFLLLYGLMLAALVAYAIGWQQVIKHLPLTTAYANKAVTVVWGILLGRHPAAGCGGRHHHCRHCAVCACRQRRGGRQMNQAQLPYVLLYLCSTFLSSVSQVLLKKAAMREHTSLVAEYTDWRVILGYGLFVGCTLLTMLAYKGVPLNIGPVLEATGYLYVTIFGVTIFHEKMNPKKIAALVMIVAGILVYAL